MAEASVFDACEFTVVLLAWSNPVLQDVGSAHIVVDPPKTF